MKISISMFLPGLSREKTSSPQPVPRLWCWLDKTLQILYIKYCMQNSKRRFKWKDFEFL